MVELKQGVVVSFRRLSPVLGVFRLRTEDTHRFPEYKAGQYVALRREECYVTRRVADAEGRPHYVPDVDETGHLRRGPVTHSYSIASAPFETAEEGHLEFYVVLEQDELGLPGRLTASLFNVDPEHGDRVGYFNRITGDFTLEKRAAGFRDVVFVGTGTGIAPFVSMLKQLHNDAGRGKPPGSRYTLFYANRTRAELAYHEELAAIAGSGRLDFLYVPSVSRPREGDADVAIGRGRANNLLRLVLDMPLKEEEDLDAAPGMGEDIELARHALAKAVMPVLPGHLSRSRLRERLLPTNTVILTCGNATSMADIRQIADVQRIRFEKEDWKPTRVGKS